MLVDLCRQSIVFETIECLVNSLKAISEDPEIKILRVKNRLDFSYDSGQSAGYRDVALNLRLETVETQKLGLTGHVCEVQLLLQPFAELKVKRISFVILIIYFSLWF